ncbi:MAG: HAD-IA family hydrolase [Methyloceanibacter sp.]|jgi:phosphoglycolate phosphatase
MLRHATIVFDLDGTLVDTAPDLTNALNDVLVRRGHEPVSGETIRACVGHGAQAMIEAALRRVGAGGDLDRMLAEFLDHYEANIAAESRPFPGAVAALESLASQGATLAVCTNKREHLSRKLLQELDLGRYFAGLAGRDTFPVSKPDPRHLTGTIKLAGGPNAAVMVGDSDIDVMTANAAGVPIVLARFGYGPPPKDGARADASIGHFDELEARIQSLLEAPATSRSA